MSSKYVITITYGERVENHAGNQMIGKLASSGMNFDDLNKAKEKFEEKGFTTDFIDLVKEGEVDKLKCAEACLLVVRNYVDKVDEINKEVLNFEWDKKCWMRGRVVNKNARWNLCYADEGQEPCYEEKKGRIIPFKDVPSLSKIREELYDYVGEKGKKLYAEGNYYYDTKKTYIGFHGDSERKIVIALRLGTEKMPIHYQWFLNSGPIGKRIKIDLNPGDLYIMSEKAVGTDWKRKIIPTLRHATAVDEKLLKIKKEEIETKIVKKKKKIIIDDSDDENDDESDNENDDEIIVKKKK